MEDLRGYVKTVFYWSFNYVMLESAQVGREEEKKSENYPESSDL